MNGKTRRMVAILAITGLVLVVAGALLAQDEDSVFAAAGLRPRPKPAVTNLRPAHTPVPTPAPVGIQVAFRLDPWLVSGVDFSGVWASPAVFGPAAQNDKTFTVEARVQGFDGGRGRVRDAQWSSADASIVNVTPARGKEVTINVKKAGQTTVQVSAPGVSRQLAINSVAVGDGLQVQITQK